ncbi:RES family NAD+ phosphorylase [Actinacidiphila sp. ITFR-21]|uniref:RES family NAD+ phosphorylase n=1 Tax=Actinacidiphila sp. ITFR-21 TaxID=3075199 RepID=UPI002889C2A7|nr:RES family NAD+ phosphorylase [Streptomyces sp. ITFR-21]WNI16105.1 RES family NAD+ phosphorylase [Streptomyces sp. ITFR-21]
MSRGDTLPEKGTADARPVTYRAGELFYRVHSRDYPAHAFNRREQDPHFGGNRFGSTGNDRYSYLYAAPEQRTAVAETLLRGVRFGPDGKRLLPYAWLADRLLSQVRLARDVELVSLVSTPDLSAVQQEDYWLVHSAATEYAFTRRWGHWLRAEASWADGFVWVSHQDMPAKALVLFGAESGDEHTFTTTGEPPIALDGDAGVDWLNGILRDYHVTVGPRTPAAAPGGH